MKIDFLNTYSWEQAITETCDSDRSITLEKGLGFFDEEVTPQLYDMNDRHKLIVFVAETFNGLTGDDEGGLTITLQTKDVTDVSWTDTVITRTILVADIAKLTAGNFLMIEDYPINLKEMTQIRYTVVGAEPDTGKISTFRGEAHTAIYKHLV